MIQLLILLATQPTDSSGMIFGLLLFSFGTIGCWAETLEKISERKKQTYHKESVWNIVFYFSGSILITFITVIGWYVFATIGD